MTGTEIMRESFEDIQAVSVGGTIDAVDTTAAFRRLCQIIGNWHMAGIEVPVVLWASLSLAAAQGSYTIGEDGTPDKDTTRPDKIRGAFVRDSGDNDNALRRMTEAEYRSVSTKAEEGRPSGFWYHDTYPNGTLYVWPVPTATETMHIFYSAPMSEPASVAAEVLVPRGYDLPLVHQLSLELLPRYGLEPSQIQYKLAKDSKKQCIAMCARKKLNSPKLSIMASGRSVGIIQGGGTGEGLLELE
jgi:hypothetical protein